VELHQWKIPPLAPSPFDPPAERDRAVRLAAEAPIRYDVAVRCGPCHRSLGRQAPALAFLERLPESDHRQRRWALYRVDHRGILAGARDNQGGDVISSDSWNKLRAVGLALQEGRPPPDPRGLGRVGLVEPVGVYGRGKGIELACRRCRHKPQRKLRTLYALAERALDKDEREIYLD
jgi:hypothetical protein